MPRVSEIFGVTPGVVPLYTYVDRERLDEKLEGFLRDAKRHIVIHGASKQGKTTLRKRNLPESHTVLVLCRPDSTVESLYRDVLNQLEAAIPSKLVDDVTQAKGNDINGSGGVQFGVFSASVGAGHTSTTTNSATTESTPVGIDETSLRYVANQIKSSGKWVALEDFHYLSEREKSRLAHDLHGFGDIGAHFIIVGVWHEDDVLAFYNPDLIHRYDEINLKWTWKDLAEVIKQGEAALQIRFTNGLRQQGFVMNAMNSVGLVQELALRFCEEIGIHQTIEPPRVEALSDADPLAKDALTRAIQKVCATYTPRYRRWAEAMTQGFTDDASLRLYENIARACIEADARELRAGLYKDTLLERVQQYAPRTRSSDLSGALSNLDRLQLSKKVSPVVISYDSNSQRVLLIDQELFFFLRHSKYIWPWQQRRQPKGS